MANVSRIGMNIFDQFPESPRGSEVIEIRNFCLFYKREITSSFWYGNKRSICILYLSFASKFASSCNNTKNIDSFQKCNKRKCGGKVDGKWFHFPSPAPFIITWWLRKGKRYILRESNSLIKVWQWVFLARINFKLNF